MRETWRFGKQRKRRRWLRISGWFMLVLLVLVAVRALIPPGTPALKAEGSIAALEQVRLGGVEQWVLMRGVDRTAPVVLFIHGGPGNPQISVARRFMRQLEEHFVVVNWDQRGAGKSWSSEIDPATMTVEQFVDDTLELTDWLRERFDQDKIFIVGHSWGSYIGTLAVREQPELFHAYIGVGQMVSFEESESLSYQYTIEAARRQANAKAVAELEALGPPPYPRGMDDVIVQRNWLARLGGLQRQVNMTLEIARSIALGREYTLLDGWRYVQGATFSIEHLYDALTEVDLFEQVGALDVPVWFVTGKHDYITVPSVTQRYSKELGAPSAEFVLFENSAHLPLFEEPERFVDLMLSIMGQTIGIPD